MIDVFDNLDKVYRVEDALDIFQAVVSGKLFCRQPGLCGRIRFDTGDLNRWHRFADRYGDMSRSRTDIQHPSRGRQESPPAEIIHKADISQTELPALTFRVEMLLDALHWRWGYRVYMSAVITAAFQRVQMYSFEAECR